MKPAGVWVSPPKRIVAQVVHIAKEATKRQPRESPQRGPRKLNKSKKLEPTKPLIDLFAQIPPVKGE
jgi:hypothetical protein